MRDDTYAMLKEILTRPTRSSLEMLQLLARIELEERDQHTDPNPQNGRASPTLSNVVIDRRAMRVWADGHEVALTRTEIRILMLLNDHEGEMMAYGTMLRMLSPNPPWADMDSRALRVHVDHLRNKIERNPNAPHRIITVRGFGYRFDNTPVDHT